MYGFLGECDADLSDPIVPALLPGQNYTDGNNASGSD
jgi:hypothetical protein